MTTSFLNHDRQFILHVLRYIKEISIYNGWSVCLSVKNCQVRIFYLKYCTIKHIFSSASVCCTLLWCPLYFILYTLYFTRKVARFAGLFQLLRRPAAFGSIGTQGPFGTTKGPAGLGYFCGHILQTHFEHGLLLLIQKYFNVQQIASEKL